MASIICGCGKAEKGATHVDAPLVADSSSFESLPLSAEQKALSGRYVQGTGLYGTEIELTSDGRFRFRTRRDLIGAAVRSNFGHARLKQGVLHFAPKKPLEWDEEWERLSQRAVPIRWGKRIYLISDDERSLIAFCNSINRGYEPRRALFGGLYLREGDEKHEVSGQPTLPAEWKSYLLPKPVWALIVEVDGNTARIDKGARSGLKRGHVLWNVNTGDVYRVDDEGQSSSRIVRESSLHSDPIAKGEQLCTRDRF